MAFTSTKKKIDVQRAPNFKDSEVEILVQLVKKHKNVLELKKSDVISWREKDRAWDEIALEMNAITSVNRSSKTLRDKYKNLKTESKKKFADEKCEVYKTGGGKVTSVDISSVDLQIKELCGVQIEGLKNTFDSDSLSGPCEEIVIEVEEVDSSQGDLSPPVGKEYEGPSWNQSQWEAEGAQSVSKVISKPDLCSPLGKENTTDWSSWNPLKLKEQISPSLRSPLSKPQGTPKKKTQLTQDCRIKFNILSEAKLQLVNLQKECVKKDIQYKNQEHMLKIEQMKDDQKMKQEKHNLEIQILKKQL